MVRIALIPCLDNARDKEPPRIALDREQIRNMFKKHDTNKDGKLTWDELKAAFNSLGSRSSGFRAWRALKHADINKDKCINTNDPEFDALIDYVLIRCAYKFG